MTADAQGWDPAVIVDGHVSWALLTTAEQADLIANFPKLEELVGDEAQEARFEKALDAAYLCRHTVCVGFLFDQS